MENKKLAILLDYADLNDGYVSVAEAKGLGIAQTYLQMAVEGGQFEKVAKGLYLKKGYNPDPYYVIHHTYRRVVFSFKSAMRLQGLLEEKEGDIHLYLPINYMTKGIDGCSCRHVGNKEFNLGQCLAITPHGTLVPTFDKERCFIELLRYPEKFEEEQYKNLLKKAPSWGLDKDKLREYAEAFNVIDALKVVYRLFGF